MDAIFKEYGGAILAAVGAVAIITLLLTGMFGGFNGIYETLGGGMSAQSSDGGTADLTAYAMAVEDNMTEIKLNKGDFHSGVDYGFSSMFVATNSQGNTTSAEVYKVTSVNGDSVENGDVGISTNKIRFNKTGTYRLYARCLGEKTTVQFCVSVI